ncbi:MAG: alanine racemase [Bacillaceae bacterium]|nr:alanine racemase [Bacillaceae bacterium]
METPGYRDTWVEVDLNAISANVALFSEHLPPKTEIMAVVKADGYGHGAVPVAEAALAQGASVLGVAFLGEAVQLREAGFDTPVVVLGYTAPDYMKEAVKHQVSITIYHIEALKALEQSARYEGIKGAVHIKVDTGMSRIGLRYDDPQLMDLIRYTADSPYLEFEGIFTHYATADEIDHPHTRLQMARFVGLLENLQKDQLLPRYIHASNSAAATLYPENSHSLIRLGISLYGLHPSAEVRKAKQFPLQEAFSLKTRVSHVKTLPPGEPVSYGATYASDQEEVIATLPIGYADGYSRSLSNKGEVLVHGTRAPIVGRICMDQTMVRVTHIPGVEVGDEVVLIGKQGEDQISMDEVAHWLNTINYEVPCIISKRVPRIYKK